MNVPLELNSDLHNMNYMLASII